MKFSYNLLQEYFKEKLPEPEKLANVLTMHSFEVEGVEKSGDDYILNIDILPNRMPDCGGHFYLAKEIFTVLNYGGLLSKNSFKSKKTARLPFKQNSEKNKLLKIKIENNNLCPRYFGIKMKGVETRESPEWLKIRLESLGINSINNLVDAANYAMLILNQPLHIFDADKIDEGIFVRNAKKGESILTLDNKKYDLNENILVIADHECPLAIAGIKGGKKAEVDFGTKNIIIEAANFDRSAIRKASQILNLRTDASVRFGAGIDPNLVLEAMPLIVSLIKELGGKGKIVEIKDVYSKFTSIRGRSEKKISKNIILGFDKIKKVLAAPISLDEVKKILKAFDFKFSVSLKKGATLFEVEIPTVRQDLEIEEDMIEEIGRVYGYEKINPISPSGTLIPGVQDEENNTYQFLKIIKNFFAGQGFNEVYNYSFVGENDLEIFGVDEKENNFRFFELENPLSPDLKFLRPLLIFNMLRAASLNLKNYDEFRLFEIGKIFSPDGEKRHLAGILARKEGGGSEMFYKAKGVLSVLIKILGISDFIFSENLAPKTANPFLHPYRAGVIKINGKEIGFLGEIKSEVLKNYDIKNGNVVYFEIDFDAFCKDAEREREFEPFSRFPSVTRDLSLFVPYNTRIVEVEDIINNMGGEFLFDSDLFDIYEDDKFASASWRKSLTFRLVFESKERTLTDKEVDAIMDKIFKALEEKDGWEVRK